MEILLTPYQIKRWKNEINQISVMAKEISHTSEEFMKALISYTWKISNNQHQFNYQQFKQQVIPWKYELKSKSQSPICSKRIHQSPIRVAFSCFTCRQIDNSILCYDCFSSSDHDGHHFLKFETKGGCCDCGDTEAWNPKGFCSRHNTNKDLQIKEEIQMQKLFKEQLTLAYFIYFWLNKHCDEQIQFRKLSYLYGIFLLEYSADLISQQYQLKYLMNEVFHSDFSRYSKYIDDADLNIIERYFRLEIKKQLAYFNKMAIQLFPVEKFRYTYIRQYFLKTFNNEMLYDHPLKQLNYQYMGRAKIIRQFIERGELKPLLLDKCKEIQNNEIVNSLNKKYLDDISYLLKPKSAYQYFKLHFNRINICDMLFFREYSKIQDIVNNLDDEKIEIDQYFIKIFGDILKLLKNQKLLLLKIIKQLFAYIRLNQKQTYSIIHQRVLGFTIMAYLDGQLKSINHPDVRKQLLASLIEASNSEINVDQFIIKQIKKFLYQKIFADNLNQQIYMDYFRSNFIMNYPQKYLLSSLDLLYVKILLKLSDKIDTSSMIYELLCRSEKSEYGLIILKTMTQVLTLDVDELIIGVQLDIANRQRCYSFLKRVIKTYNNISAKQIKQILIVIFNDNSLIQNLLMKEVKMQKGKIIIDKDIEALEYLLYKNYLSKNEIDRDQLKLRQTNKLNKNIQFEDYNIYNRQIVKYIYQLLDKQINQELVIQLIKIHLQLNQQESKIRLKLILSKNNIKNKDIINQINHIVGQQKQTNSGNQQQNIRKQLLLKKRREKEQLMKKKQNNMLKIYESVQQNLNQTCIYCKQNNNNMLYYVSYVQFTNLYQLKLSKNSNNNKHLFFDSCGHKIHQKCYQIYLHEVQQLNICFLCKNHVNILIPSISLDKSKQCQSIKSILNKFKQNIYPILLNIYYQQLEVLQQYYAHKHKENISSILLQSFIKEIIFRIIYLPEDFQKYIYQIYLIIYQIIKLENISIASLLENIRQIIKQQNNNKNTLSIQSYFIQLIQSNLTNKQFNRHKYQDHHSQYQLIFLTLDNIILSFSNKKVAQYFKSPIQIQQIQPLFNHIPQLLADLLPSKPICQQCKKITNRLLSCLLCNWNSCDDHFNSMKIHTKQSHIGTVFIFLYNGQIIQVFKDNVHIGESIYVNYIGQSATKDKSPFTKQRLSKLYLNMNSYDSLRKNVIRHMIHNQATK